MVTIVVLGAGSTEFARSLFADLFTSTALADAHVVLHDNDAERLATAHRLAASTSANAGSRARITATLDRREALRGADFVINQIAVGGFEAIRRDFDIPHKYGVRQTIADTLGLGGIFRALRTIPVMVSIGNDMAELCPDAWLLNYTNPMTMVPWDSARRPPPATASVW